MYTHRTIIKTVITFTFFISLFSTAAVAQTISEPIPLPPMSAEEAKKNPPDPKSMVPTGEPIKPIATVNIQDGFIIGKDGNSFDIAFSLSNREEVQTGIRYGVRLVSNTEKGEVVIDEKVYDEEVTLLTNDRVLKRITYTAPEFLTGEYSLYLSSSNQSGFPFGYVFVDKVQLAATKTGIVIDPASCSVHSSDSATSLPLSRTGVVTAGQIITITCTGTNTATSVIPAIASFETREKSAYGRKLPPAPEGTTSIIFTSLEKKTFSFTLPRQTEPGLYYTQAALFAGSQISNPILLRYAVKGKTATIENVSFDKASYKKGDTANLSLIWYGTVETKEEADAAAPYNLTVSMKNTSGKECAAPVKKDLSFEEVGKTTIELPLKAVCKDPIVTVSINEPNGSKIYDTRDFSIKVSNSSVDSRTAILIIGAVVLLAIISLYMRYKKIHTSKNVVVPMAMFSILFLGGIFFAPNAYADTYDSCVQGYDQNCYSYEGSIIRTTVNLNKSIYSPGEAITVTGQVQTLPGPWGGGGWGYAVLVNMQHLNANNRYYGGNSSNGYNYYAQSPTPRLLPSYDSGVSYWDGTLPKYQYGYSYWGTGPYAEAFMYSSTALHTYSGFTAWPDGTPGPYSVLFWTNYFSYNAGWHGMAVGPYELFYTIALPDNRSMNAGPDMTLSSPISNPTLTLNGAVTGDFNWYGWQKIAGPTDPSKQYDYNGTAQYETSGMVPGTYTFRLGGSGTNSMDYYDDMNVVVQEAVALPDLIVPYYGQGTLEIASNNTGQNISFDVENIGSANTGTGYYGIIQVAADANGNSIVSTSAPFMIYGNLYAYNATSTQGYVNFPSQPGTYYYRACADKSSAGDAGTITESNENNNCGTWVQATVFQTACTDAIDNDSDTKIDSADPGCDGISGYDPYDNNELNAPQCSDGVDNVDAEDAVADSNDSGCRTNGVYDPYDNDETYTGPVYQCSDGVDNADAEDTLVDTLDPGCHTDSNAGNASSYGPNDNDETDKKKPIFIDF